MRLFIIIIIFTIKKTTEGKVRLLKKKMIMNKKRGRVIIDSAIFIHVFVQMTDFLPLIFMFIFVFIIIYYYYNSLLSVCKMYIMNFYKVKKK